MACDQPTNQTVQVSGVTDRTSVHLYRRIRFIWSQQHFILPSQIVSEEPEVRFRFFPVSWPWQAKCFVNVSWMETLSLCLPYFLMQCHLCEVVCSSPGQALMILVLLPDGSADPLTWEACPVSSGRTNFFYHLSTSPRLH